MTRPAVSRRPYALLAIGVLVSLMIGIAGPAAQAEPPSAGPGDTTPSSVASATQAWLDSSERAALANDEVLQAQEREQQARDGAKSAAQELARAESAAVAADQASTRAAEAAEELTLRAREFAAAAFRGARLNTMGALLTADSPNDFLDQAEMLDQVGADVQSRLDAATAAEQRARQAARNASSAAADARKAREVADTAVTTAARATAEVRQQQAALRADVAKYRDLTRRLTEQERQEALAAQQRAFERQAEQQPAAPAPPSVSPADSPDSGEPAASAAGRAAVQAALSKLGSRYVWGASGPNEFDCSGLTSWAWAQAGVTIPRTSRGQSGLTRVPLDQLRPGDLVTYYSPVSHVAMYIGDGKVVQASTESMPVYISSVYGAGPNPTGYRVGG